MIYPISSIRIKYQKSNTRYQVSDIESDIKYQILSIRNSVSDVEYQISSIRYRVSDIDYQILSIRYQVSDIEYQMASITSIRYRVLGFKY